VIDELLIVAFFANAASMCVEDLETSSVPLCQALASLLIACIRHTLGETRAAIEWAPLSFAEVMGFLLLFVLIKSGRTGSADLVFLLSLRVLFPERIELKGASFLLIGRTSVTATISEISLANALLLALRYRTVSLFRRRELASSDYVFEFLALFAPLAWALSVAGERDEETIPFIPFLIAGAIIGMSFNTLLL